MELFRSHPGSQTAIFLAGCILSCWLQLVPARENLTVVSVPKDPLQGQSVLLYAKNLQEAFLECKWTHPSGSSIVFIPDAKFTPFNTSQVAVLYQNCSLSIKNAGPRDQGKYTIKATFPAAKQQEAKGSVIYTGSIDLTVCGGKSIRINVDPPSPCVGQDATLTPQGIPGDHGRCQWTQKTQSGTKNITEGSGQESKKEQNQQQKIKQHGCSLHLFQLTLADSGNYSVYIDVSSGQDPGKGKGTSEQVTCYRSQTELKVEGSGSTSIKYSTGIIAGVLLGSLTWTSSLSLLPLLFGVLSPFFPEC